MLVNGVKSQISKKSVGVFADKRSGKWEHHPIYPHQ